MATTTTTWSLKCGGKINNHYYLLDQDRGHYNFVETLNVIRKIRVSYPDTLFVLIEDKANGTAIINVLSDEMEGIIPVEPSGGKSVKSERSNPLPLRANVSLSPVMAILQKTLWLSVAPSRTGLTTTKLMP